MKITVKRISKYKEVTLEDRGTKIDLGLLDEKEAEEMAEQFREAADALST